MINENRIVPIQAVDLISMYGLVLQQNSSFSALAKLDAVDDAGDFQIKTNSALVIASEPVKACDVDATASSVSAFTMFFVPAYDYKGFTVDGGAATIANNGVTVAPDGRTLYKAVLSSGTITITKVGF